MNDILTENFCCECLSWIGRCDKGKKNRLASSLACEEFLERR
jgi:hypothetical protein